MARTIRVKLSDHPALQEPGGGVLLRGPGVLLVRGKHKGTLRAFSARCPHKPKEGRVELKSGKDGCRLACPLHDWTFSRKGKPTGKAKRGLERLELEQDGDELVIRL